MKKENTKKRKREHKEVEECEKCEELRLQLEGEQYLNSIEIKFFYYRNGGGNGGC